MAKKVAIMLFFILLLSVLPGFTLENRENITWSDNEYTLVYPFQNGVARAEKDLKWGSIAVDGTIKIPFIYDYLGEESNDLRLMLSGDRYGYVGTDGKTVVAPQFEQAHSFSAGYAAVKKDGLWGYINTEGKEVVAPQFEEANNFTSALARTKKDGKYGYINTNGETVIDFTYEEAYDFYEGLACVYLNEKYGYIDPSGQEIISAKFDVALDFCESAAAVCIDGKWGYINTNGTSISDFLWDSATSFSNGYAVVEKNGKYGILQKNGSLCVPVKYEQIGELSEGLFPFCENERWGYLSPDGNQVMKNEYEAAKPFSNGLAAVCMDGKWGALNHNGDWVVSPNFADCGAYSDGFLPITTENGFSGWLAVTAETSAVTTPSEHKKQIRLQIGKKEIDINGKKQELSVAPILKNDTTMLPIRAIVEGIGGRIDWDPQLKRITIKNQHSEMVLKIGDKKARVDGIYFPLTCAPYISEGSTLVPLRFVTQTLGCDVKWLAESKEVVIIF